MSASLCRYGADFTPCMLPEGHEGDHSVEVPVHARRCSANPYWQDLTPPAHDINCGLPTWQNEDPDGCTCGAQP